MRYATRIEDTDILMMTSAFSVSTSSVCKTLVGKMSSSKLFQIPVPRFRLFGTFTPDNVNARWISYLYSEGSPSWRSICNSCGHLLHVVVFLHFELTWLSRSLRERLPLITPHWPLYLKLLMWLQETSIFASLRKEDLMFGIRPSLREIRRRLSSSIPKRPCSGTCRYTETVYSESSGQTQSELDVQTSRFLLNFDTDRRLQTSKTFSRRPEESLFMTSYVKHRTAWAQSSWLLRLRYERTETDTWIRWCTAARRGDLSGKCFDQCSFECIDFQVLSQNIASLTKPHAWKTCREKGRNCKFPFVTKRKKITSWRSADLVFAPDVPRNQCSAFTLLPMKTATLWRMKTNRAGDCAKIGVRFLSSRIEGERHHCHETILRYVQKSSWWHTFGNRQKWIWPQKKGIGSGPWWDSVLPLQVRCRLVLSVSLQRIHTRDWGWPSSSAICRQ